MLSAVCKHYGISKEEVTNAGKGEAKKMCLYLLKKHTVASTREIGCLLGNMKYAAAAKMYQRFVRDLAENDQLRREVKGLGKRLSYVEG